MEEVIDFRDVWRVLKRNLRLIALSLTVCAVGAIVLTLYLPKRYKAQAALSIHASYFQNPLVSNLISDVYDPSELRAQRSALLRLALSNDFLDSLGEEWGVFQFAKEDKLRQVEREMLLQSIEYYPLSPNTFQVAVSGPEPHQAYNMTSTVLAQMIGTLVRERREKLMATRDAIAKHVRSLSQMLRDNPVQSSTDNIEVTEVELQRLRADLSLLLGHFTEQHPEVVTLRDQINSLQARLNILPKPKEVDLESEKGFLMTAIARRPVNEVHDELVKKLSNLEIVLSLEGETNNVSYLSVIEQPALPVAPLFPRKSVFLGFGLLLGSVLAGVLVLFVELQRGTFLSPQQLSYELGMPLLGELPLLEEESSPLLLPQSTDGYGKRKMLPPYERRVAP